MAIFFLILIILSCVIIGFFILVQNPKGGGLAGNIAGFSTQFMGVKQTTDVLEKGTWLFAAIIAILSLTSTVFISKTASEDKIEKVNPNAATQQRQPANNATPFPGVAPGADSGKK